MMQAQHPVRPQKSGVGEWLSGLHFFRKVPTDLTRGTIKGGVVSMACLVFMLVLTVSEFARYFETKAVTEVLLDDHPTEDIRIRFNITMHHIPCRFLELQLEDKAGKPRADVDLDKLQITNIDTHLRRSTRYDPHAKLFDDLDDSDDELSHAHDGKLHKGEPHWLDPTEFKQELKAARFAAVTFFSVTPGCEMSQLWRPGWAVVHRDVQSEALDGEIYFASINCSTSWAHRQLCRDHGIVGTPAIRMYHGDPGEMKAGTLAHDARTVSEMPRVDTSVSAMKDLTKEFHGQRMVDVVSNWILAERTVSSGDANLDLLSHDVGNHVPGCEVAGVLNVARSPGNIYLSSYSDSHTFDEAMLNTSHTVNVLTFGATPSSQQTAAIQALPASESVVLDALHGKVFSTTQHNQTIHHYLKVLGTDFDRIKMGWQQTLIRALQLFVPISITPTGKGIVPLLKTRMAARFVNTSVAFKHNFDETFQAKHIFDLGRHPSDWQLVHQYASTDTRYRDLKDHPGARFSYDLSPLMLLVKRVPASNYIFNSFWVSLCAIIGGVFTVGRAIDSLVHSLAEFFHHKPVLLRA